MFSRNRKAKRFEKVRAELASAAARQLVNSDGGRDALRIAELSEQVRARDDRITCLTDEVKLLRTAIKMLQEDLSIKDDQFDKLFSSLKASSEFAAQNNVEREKSIQERYRKLEVRNKHLQHQIDSSRVMHHETKLKEQSSNLLFGDSLPFDVRARISSFLGFADHARACCVSRDWNDFHSKTESWFLEYVAQLDPELHCDHVSRVVQLAPCARSGPHNWKRHFVDKYSKEKSWHARPRITTLVAHRGTVTCLGVVKQDVKDGSVCRRLVSGSDDGSLRMWDITKHQTDSAVLSQQHHIATRPARKLRAFQGHGGPVWAMRLSDDGTRLWSGSYDRTIKVWDTHRGTCLQTLRRHTKWVSCLDTTTNVLISGSWDANIHMWNNQGRVVGSIVGNHISNAIYTLKCEGSRIAAGGRDSQVRIYDIESITSTPLMALTGHKSAVNELQIDQKNVTGRIVTASSDGTIKIWNQHGQCVGTFYHSAKLHTGVMCVSKSGYRVASGGYDSTINMYDLRKLASNSSSSSSLVKTFEAHSGAIFSLELQNDCLVSGSADHTIRVWDFE